MVSYATLMTYLIELMPLKRSMEPLCSFYVYEYLLSNSCAGSHSTYSKEPPMTATRPCWPFLVSYCSSRRNHSVTSQPNWAYPCGTSPATEAQSCALFWTGPSRRSIHAPVPCLSLLRNPEEWPLHESKDGWTSLSHEKELDLSDTWIWRQAGMRAGDVTA